MSEKDLPFLRGNGFDVYEISEGEEIKLPGGFRVNCGFPSPAADFDVSSIDLNKMMIRNKNTTFFGVASGDSMKGVGIFDKAIFVIDKGLEAQDKSIVICFLNGEATCKRVGKIGRSLFLLPENDDFKPIALKEGDELQIWGVVTWACNKMY